MPVNNIADGRRFYRSDPREENRTMHRRAATKAIPTAGGEPLQNKPLHGMNMKPIRKFVAVLGLLPFFLHHQPVSV
jgi:hypothetical protein